MDQTVMPLLSHFSVLAAGSLLATAWQTLLLAAAVALYLRLLPGGGAGVRYTMWAAMLPVILLLPVLSFLLGPSAASATSLHRPGPIPVLHLGSHWSFAIAALWVVFSLLRAVQLARSAIRLQAIAREAIPVPEHQVFTTSPSTGRQRSATLCTTDSDQITQPSVVGFRSPRILIPRWMYARLTPAELNQIALHEMEHLRRRDDWMNLIQKVSLVLLPLNPALLWVERRLCHERELACDDAVLRATAAPKVYASCLVHLAEQRMLFRQMPLALGAWSRPSELGRRIDHILRTHTTAMTRKQAAAATTVLLLGLVGGSAALSRSPQMVSFAPSTASFAPSTTVFSPTAAGTAGSAAMPSPITTAHAVLARSASSPVSISRPHVTLLKATMPSPEPAPAETFPATRRHVKLLGKQKRLHRPQPLVMVTSWHQATSWRQAPSASRMVLAIENFEEPTQFSPTYAAVPTDGGWIVFQL